MWTVSDLALRFQAESYYKLGVASIAEEQLLWV